MIVALRMFHWNTLDAHVYMAVVFGFARAKTFSVDHTQPQGRASAIREVSFRVSPILAPISPRSKASQSTGDDGILYAAEDGG
jgi:hypothetical protein